MTGTKINADSTIADIASTLSDPVEYVRRVLGNMHPVKKQFGNAFVRIGITGRGVVPHYRVEPGFRLEDFTKEELEAQFVAYHGRSHDRLPWGLTELKGDNWSTGKTSYEEVQQLLGRLRSVR